MEDKYKLDPEMLKYYNKLVKEEDKQPTEPVLNSPVIDVEGEFNPKLTPVKFTKYSPAAKKETNDAVIETISKSLKEPVEEPAKDSSNGFNWWSLLPLAVGVLEGDSGAGAGGAAEMLKNQREQANKIELEKQKEKELKKYDTLTPYKYTDENKETRIGKWSNRTGPIKSPDDPIAGYAPTVVTDSEGNPVIVSKGANLGNVFGETGKKIDGVYTPTPRIKKLADTVSGKILSGPYKLHSDARKAGSNIAELLDKENSSETDMKIAMKQLISMFDGKRQSDRDLAFIEFSRSWIEKAKQLAGMQVDPANREQFRRELRSVAQTILDKEEESFNEITSRYAATYAGDDDNVYNYFINRLNPRERILKKGGIRSEKKAKIKEKKLSSEDKKMLDTYNSSKDKKSEKMKKLKEILANKGIL